MNSRQRLLTALQRGRPDRLPVTTHHVMPYFLDKYLDGISSDAFFDRFGFDAIRWTLPFKAEAGAVAIDRQGFTRSPDWQVEMEDVPGGEYQTTRSDMGGDVGLAEAKRRIGDKVCLIGGFDQVHFFTDCTPEQTRAEVRRCFQAVGEGGGYILSPSDHFFDAHLALLSAFADEAQKCLYPVRP